VALASDLKVGERVRLVVGRQDGVHEVLEVRDDAFRTSFRTEDEGIFVYGREVDDFRTVDYEAIAMLNVSATQEIYRRLTESRETISALEAQLGALREESRKREARLTAIEQLLAPKSQTAAVRTASN
jgi:predicted phage tail protein